MKCESCGATMKKVLTNKTLRETLYKCEECTHRIVVKEKADESTQQEDTKVVC